MTFLVLVFLLIGIIFTIIGACTGGVLLFVGIGLLVVPGVALIIMAITGFGE